MNNVGILESSVPLNKYFCSSSLLSKSNTVYVINLAKDTDFEI